jgi:recombination protein RecR
VSGEADPITELVNQLTRLPGIGEKTATRLAFFIVQSPEGLAEELAQAVVAARSKVMCCTTCGMLTEADPCRYCSDVRRESETICVVEQTPDVVAVERTFEFRGHYHVLGGLIRPLDGTGPDDLNLESLVSRIGGGGVSEVIVATNPSVEGEATAMYIRNLLSPLGVSVSRIASGLPLGGELEYADRATLGRAIAARVSL